MGQEYQKCIGTFLSTIAPFKREGNPNTSWQIIKGNIRDETVKYRKKRAEATPIQQLKINTVAQEQKDKFTHNENFYKTFQIRLKYRQKQV